MDFPIGLAQGGRHDPMTHTGIRFFAASRGQDVRHPDPLRPLAHRAAVVRGPLGARWLREHPRRDTHLVR